MLYGFAMAVGAQLLNDYSLIIAYLGIACKVANSCHIFAKLFDLPSELQSPWLLDFFQFRFVYISNIKTKRIDFSDQRFII
jgi:hypothetical protein